MQYNLGRVVPIFQGEYSESQSYEVLDVVLYKGSSFVAKTDTLGNIPTDTKYWQMVASAGDGSGAVITVDAKLSTESVNPVQNKVITLKINDLESIIVPEETVRQIVEGYSYQNKAQVDANIEGRGFETAAETDEKLKPYAKKTDIATINGQVITNGGNITVGEGGSSITVDSELSTNSENPVQNKVITTRINEVEGKIKPVPTKVSELTNDSDFQSASQVQDYVNGKGYQTAQEVETAITAKDYITDAAVEAKGYTTLNEVAQQGYAMNSDIPTNNNQLDNGAGYTTMQAVEAKGYQTSSDIDARGYQTDAQVKATITANPDGYAKTTDVDTKLSKKADSTRVDEVVASIPDTTEAWEFTLEDGSIITKNVYIQA